LASEQKNPEELSLDELRALAFENFDQPTPDATPARDEQGRFVARTEPEVVEQPAADEEVVYQYTIDLGDGAGVQVFERNQPLRRNFWRRTASAASKRELQVTDSTRTSHKRVANVLIATNERVLSDGQQLKAVIRRRPGN